MLFPNFIQLISSLRYQKAVLGSDKNHVNMLLSQHTEDHPQRANNKITEN